MKPILALVFATATSTAFSQEANTYHCVGKIDGIKTEVHMTTSSISGAPTLSIETSGAHHTFSNLSQVTAKDSNMGHIVSGYFDGIADATLAQTLIVPEVVLNQARSLSKIKGLLITTWSNGFRSPSVDNPHALQSNTVTEMLCTAEKLTF